jgi:hypothetical protein
MFLQNPTPNEVSSPLFSYWHEIVFGALLTNIAIGFAVVRFLWKISKRYVTRVNHFFEKIDILWRDYGVRKYGQNDGVDIFEKLDQEIVKHVRFE